MARSPASIFGTASRSNRRGRGERTIQARRIRCRKRQHGAVPASHRRATFPRAARTSPGAALGYVLEPPPEGFATWDDWRRGIGFPDSELGMGADSIIDPGGDGPRIWFRADEVAKVVKNRLHFDIHVSGGRTVIEGRSVPLATRRQRVDT